MTGQPSNSDQPKGAIVIAADHGGVMLKEKLVSFIQDLGFPVLDLGTDGPESVDYPDFANSVAEAIQDGKAEQGILICGTGLGISMAANRYTHIRAATCHDVTTARLSREHNDANVLALGARVMGTETALDTVRTFLTTPFSHAERHIRRIKKLGT